LAFPRKKWGENSASDSLPIWQEALCGVEALLLHAAPVYYGVGVPKGNGAPVVIIPGFLGSDVYLMEMYAWLQRIGYQPYYSGIGLNADCPNLLIRNRLHQTMDRIRRETRRKVHVLGHSLGGLLARAVAAERPEQVAGVITLGSPFQGTVLHPSVQKAVESVRQGILLKHGSNVLPACYTSSCSCNFLNSLRRDLPPSVKQTAVYSRMDGFVDWHYCVTGDPANDFEVAGTHIGLAFNAVAYQIVAERLAKPQPRA
jgi:pimeloyl-ACP methyl ester carboxylesterase